MKKKITTITTCILIAGTIGAVLANNKAKIDKAAQPVKENPVIPVKAYAVSTETFNTSFSLTGTTIPAREVKIASEVQGKLSRLLIKNGDFVKTGQTIAVLDASVYYAQLNSIEASIAKAKLDLSRYNNLVQLGGATKMQTETVQLQINSLEAEKKQVLEQIAHMAIRSPFDGKIENVNAEPGSFVTFGTTLGQLIDNSELKINVYLSEREAFKVKKGNPVTISSVLLSQPKHGRVTMLGDKADASGKFLAEVSFKNTDAEQLKAGVIANVHFDLPAMETGLAIPSGALLGSATDAKVFVIKNNKVEQRQITTGIITPDKVQVAGGLQEGEQVVISGHVNLEKGTSVSIIK